MAFLDISLETANIFYAWGWKLSLAGAAVTLCGVTLLMLGTRIRDHDFESQIAQLNLAAAKSNQRAAEAELELEKLRKDTAPRRMTQAQQNRISEKLSGFKNQHVSLGVNPSTNENQWLVRHIGAAFSGAGWQVEIHTGDAARNRFVPDGILVLSTLHPQGVAVAQKVADALNDEGLEASAAPLLDAGSKVEMDMADPRALRLLVVVGDRPIFPIPKIPLK